MFGINLDFKLLLIVGLSFIVLYLTFEVNGLRDDVLRIKKDLKKNNLPKNLENIKEEIPEPIDFQPKVILPQKLTEEINLPELNTNFNTNPNPPADNFAPPPGVAEELNSDIPIYSNDFEEETISVGITEKIHHDDDDNDNDNDNDNDKLKSDEELTNDLIKQVMEDKDDKPQLIEENTSEPVILSKLELEKLKKDALQNLAEKYQLSIVKEDNGKVKHKTRKDLIEDLLSYQQKNL